MEQSHLLELAKQGEPTAIAALMNAVLEPTGIMAQARWETDCLWIALESPKTLNQETLITFIQRGLLDLGNVSIRSVKVQGKKRGEGSFAWTRELDLYPNPGSPDHHDVVSSESMGEIEQVSPAMGAIALQERPEPTIDEPNFVAIDLNPVEASPDLAITSLSSLEKMLEVNEMELERTPEISEIERDTTIAATPGLTRSVESAEIEDAKEHSSSEAIATIDPMPISETDDLAIATRKEADSEEIEDDLDAAPTLRAWLKSYWQIYSLPVLLVVITGFVVGSAVAFWSTSQLQGNSVLPQEDTVENKQKEAEEYILAMNAAQEAFYQKNNRFATSLEELERSANLISQSYSYAYQLKVSDRSLITALPRESGLQSYIGAVFVAPSGTKSVVCQTMKPSMQAPTAPQFSKKRVAACAPKSIKVQ